MKRIINNSYVICKAPKNKFIVYTYSADKLILDDVKVDELTQTKLLKLISRAERHGLKYTFQ